MKSAASGNIRLRDTAGQQIKDYVSVVDQIYRCYLALKDTCKGKGRFVAEKGIAYSDVEDQKQNNDLGRDKSATTNAAVLLALEFIWILIALIIIY